MQEQLSPDAAVVTWDEDDTLRLSEFTIESALRALDRYDFASYCSYSLTNPLVSP